MGSVFPCCYSLNRPSLSRPEMGAVFSNLRFRPATGLVLLFFHPRRCYTLDEMLSLRPTEGFGAIIFGLSSNDSEKASSPPETTKFFSFFLFFVLSFSASWTEREKERDSCEWECLSILIILVVNYFYSKLFHLFYFEIYRSVDRLQSHLLILHS